MPFIIQTATVAPPDELNPVAMFGCGWRIQVPVVVGSSDGGGGPAIVWNWQQELENIDDEELAVLLTL